MSSGPILPRPVPPVNARKSFQRPARKSPRGVGRAPQPPVQCWPVTLLQGQVLARHRRARSPGYGACLRSGRGRDAPPALGTRGRRGGRRLHGRHAAAGWRVRGPARRHSQFMVSGPPPGRRHLYAGPRAPLAGEPRLRPVHGRGGVVDVRLLLDAPGGRPGHRARLGTTRESRDSLPGAGHLPVRRARPRAGGAPLRGRAGRVGVLRGLRVGPRRVGALPHGDPCVAVGSLSDPGLPQSPVHGPVRGPAAAHARRAVAGLEELAARDGTPPRTRVPRGLPGGGPGAGRLPSGLRHPGPSGRLGGRGGVRAHRGLGHLASPSDRPLAGARRGAARAHDLGAGGAVRP